MAMLRALRKHFPRVNVITCRSEDVNNKGGGKTATGARLPGARFLADLPALAACPPSTAALLRSAKKIHEIPIFLDDA